MVWPFKNEFGDPYLLECPVCQNRFQFQAVTFQGQIVWNCISCNHHATLNLVPLLSKNGAFRSKLN